MTALVLITVYIVCCIISYGAAFAYFQKSYPELAEGEYYEDMKMAIVSSSAGPVPLVLSFIMSGFFKKGFKFK